jgi:predicted DNA-binding transcriptional regulator YafY
MADALEVTQRTIYRDIFTLQAMRLPVEGAVGVGYVLGARDTLPPLTFSAEELDAIVIGLTLVGRTGDRSLQVAASQVIRKIADVVPDTAPIDIESMPIKVSLWSSIPPPMIDLRIVRSAIREERKLEVQYTDAASRHTARTVRPIALVYYEESVLLAAWCELRRDFRHFRVDRVNACRPAASRFKGEGARLRAEWQASHWPS